MTNRELPDRTIRTCSLDVGVVLRRAPGVTRWARWSWTVIALLSGAPKAEWRVLREVDGATDFHAATLPLTLYRTDVEAYRVALAMTPPSAFVAMTRNTDALHGLSVHAVTASAYEAQDYADGDEEIVEPVAMPDGLVAFVQAFVDAHFVDTPFIKRKRDKAETDLIEDGVGDPRIRQAGDVYRAPVALKPRKVIH